MHLHSFAYRVVFLSILVFVACSILTDYEDYKVAFGKQYFGAQDDRRKLCFEQNVQQIRILNNLNKTTHQINQFTDMCPEDRQAMTPRIQLDAVIIQEIQKSAQEPDFRKTASTAIPQSIDWRTYVTPAKDQKGCGSCWAFSTAGLAESYFKLFHNLTYDLSEQFLIQCSSPSDSDCGGGYVHKAILKFCNSGIPLQSSYPYVSGWQSSGFLPVNGICSATDTKKPDSGVGLTYALGTTNSYIKQLLTQGPIVVGLYAEPGLFSYKSGIYSCGFVLPNWINHAVLLVGYTKNGTWILKNSWGKSWGDSGYFYLNNIASCAIQSQVFKMTMPTNIAAVSPPAYQEDSAQNVVPPSPDDHSDKIDPSPVIPNNDSTKSSSYLVSYFCVILVGILLWI